VRTRELLLRGTRYTLAAIVPVVVMLMALAKPILTVWLGPRFATASTAMVILLSYWLGYASLGVAASMLVAAGRIRDVAAFAVAVAGLNFVLSLALTPSLGLDGVVLGTTIAWVVSFPFFIALVLATFPVRLSELAREAWLPAYSTACALAAGLVAARLLFGLDTLAEVVTAGLVGIACYWFVFYAVWLRPSERILVANVARAAFNR
jgi:membrane protein EpsK